MTRSALGVLIVSMPLELSILTQLALGQRGPVTIGHLPPEVATYLKCHPAIVYLGKRELEKIVRKHTEIEPHHVQQLPFLVDKGRYISDPARPRSIVVFGRNLEDGRLYRAALKAADNGHEVWVSTFHRSKQEQEDKCVRQGKIIRDYKK